MENEQKKKFKLLFAITDMEGTYYVSGEPFWTTEEGILQEVQMSGACGYEEVK